MPTLIRPAVAADQTAITSMVRAARINPRNLHWNNFLVALEDDRIVGARQVKTHRAGTREVASGVVLPEYRRKGLSTRLMDAILARERGPLYLMCDERWAAYYEGFDSRRVAASNLPADFRREYRIGRIVTSILGFLARRKLRIIPMKRSLNDGEGNTGFPSRDL